MVFECVCSAHLQQPLSCLVLLNLVYDMTGVVAVEDMQQDFTKMPVSAMMKLYYGWLFPHDVMYKWLVYGHGTYLCITSTLFFSL